MLTYRGACLGKNKQGRYAALVARLGLTLRREAAHVCYSFPFLGGDPLKRENVKERVIM